MAARRKARLKQNVCEECRWCVHTVQAWIPVVSRERCSIQALGIRPYLGPRQKCRTAGSVMSASQDIIKGKNSDKTQDFFAAEIKKLGLWYGVRFEAQIVGMLGGRAICYLEELRMLLREC